MNKAVKVISIIGILSLTTFLIAKGVSATKNFWSNITVTVLNIPKSAKIKGGDLTLGIPIKITNQNQINIPVQYLTSRLQIKIGSAWFDAGTSILAKDFTIPKMGQISQTFMFSANLAATIVGVLIGIKKVRATISTYVAGFQNTTVHEFDVNIKVL